MKHPYKTREGGATVTIFVPYDCKNHCPFCINKGEYADMTGFSLEKICRSIERMDAITPDCDFVFTGGEPFANLEYLKAYAIDCLLTSFLFCFVGFFNGCGKTLFVMAQGMVGALGVRLPVALLVSRAADSSLFHLGLATPASTVVQIFLCGIWYLRRSHRLNRLGLIRK